MGAKRALIVDDSKSARLFLARALEKYDIDVDNAESAEAAIEYLSCNHPDVIFMDHLMPGMDGLQAVQAIKNDPRTATIPIMIYTSQEGELFLGQVRALGAFGVLPKQMRPTDVSRVLYQLHLVPERPTLEQASVTPAGTPAAPSAEPPAGSAVGESAAPAPPLPPEPSRPLTDSELREHFAELRRALVAALDTQADRIIADMRALLPPQRAASPAWAWLIAGAALAGALVGGALAWRAQRLAEGLVPVDRGPVVVAVPFAADPWGGTRLEATAKLLDRLARQSVAGFVDIRTYPGRFCLLGSAVDGYSLAPEETAFSKCDLIGNPADEALTSAQRTPLALANQIADILNLTHGALQVEVAPGEAASVLVPYPQVTGALTAGEWNRAGSANNRIEIRVR
jgi:CheY-like chemotaxis protein